MKLTPKQRESLKLKFGGKCAYCGCELGARWHADHVEAVERKLRYVQGKGFVATGELWHPENDHVGNLMPACAPCNIDKHASSLEDWRHGLQRTHEVLRRNASRYRHGLRFGLIEERPGPVVFYFERFRLVATSEPQQITPTSS